MSFKFKKKSGKGFGGSGFDFFPQHKINGTVKRGIRQGFFRQGKDLVKSGKRSIIDGPKSGRIYTMKTESGRKKRHQASAPGQAPASLTGTLWRSLDFLVRGWRSMEYGSDGSASHNGKTAAKYADELERDPSGRLKGKRSYIKRAVDKHNRSMHQHAEREIKGAFRKQ